MTKPPSASGSVDEDEDDPQPPEDLERSSPPPPSTKLEPLHEFMPTPSPAAFESFANENGAKILLTLHRQAVHDLQQSERSLETLQKKYDATMAECHTLKLQLATDVPKAQEEARRQLTDLRVIHTRVAERLKQLRNESWAVPVLTAVAGILLSLYWKLKDDDPAKTYCLWLGLTLTTCALLLIIRRSWSKRDDEKEPGPNG